MNNVSEVFPYRHCSLTLELICIYPFIPVLVSPPTSPQDTPHATPSTNGHHMTNGTGAPGQQGGESISTACAQLSEGLFELSKPQEPSTTPPPVPQRPGPVQRVQQQHRQQHQQQMPPAVSRTRTAAPAGMCFCISYVNQC